MSIQENNYSFGRAARTTTTLGMAGLVLLGGAAVGAPAMAADAAPAGDVSAAVAGSHHHGHEVTLKAPSSATKGEKVPLKGKVKKTHHHKTRVTIQEKHGKKWKTLDHTTTSKKGTFHTSDVLKGKKTVTIRATAKGHGTSATQKVTLTQASNGNGTPTQPGQPAPSGGGGGEKPTPVAKKNQNITWNQDLNANTNYVDGGIGLNATAASGLPVWYSSSDPSVVQVNEGQAIGTIRFESAGTAVITAHQDGNDTWNAAPTVTKTVTVQPKKPDDVIHVSTGQQLQEALANAKDKTVTIQLDGGTTPFNAPSHKDAQDKNKFLSMFTVGNNSNVTLIGSGELNAKGTANTVGVHAKSTLTINGDITITGGQGAYGGGIYNEGTVDLKNGATVKDNHATQDGGGIYNGHEKDSAHPGTLTLEKGSTITDNHAVSGVGIFNDGGTVTLDGGSIQNNHANTANNGDGGGISNHDGGTVNLDGGSITGNNASGGGGISNYDGGTVNLNGGSIQNNHANYVGGGIKNVKAVLYKPNGQKLKQNDLRSDGSFRDLVVSNTHAPSHSPDNIYLG